MATHQHRDSFQALTYEWDIGTPIDVLRTGSHLHMLLYVLNEMFYVYRGEGVNDADGQHVVAYEILTVVSLCCMEWHGNTLGAAYSSVNLSDMDCLQHLAWAVYNKVYMPGDLLDLTGHHDWECIIVGTTLHLIFHGRTNDEYCKPSTIASLNAEQAMKLVWQQGLLQPRKRRHQAAPVAAVWNPTIQLVVNVPPQAVSSHSTGECRPHLRTIKRIPMERALSMRPADIL